MPADVIGTAVFRKTAKEENHWAFQPGPIFTNLLLADEIIATTPKTQSAYWKRCRKSSHWWRTPHISWKNRFFVMLHKTRWRWKELSVAGSATGPVSIQITRAFSRPRICTTFWTARRKVLLRRCSRWSNGPQIMEMRRVVPHRSRCAACAGVCVKLVLATAS